MQDLYFMRVESENLKGVVELNGAPLFKTKSKISNVDYPINMWLKPQGNVVNVDLAVISEKSPWHLKLYLFLHDKNEEVPTPSRILFDLNQIEGLGDSRKKLDMNFDVKQRLPELTSVWAEAESLQSVKQEDIKEMVAIANAFATAVKEGRIEDVLKIIDYKISEDAMSEGKIKENLVEVNREGFEMLSSETGVEVSVVGNENAKVSMLGANKMVLLEKLVDDKLMDAIIFDGKDYVYEIPLYFAKINGSWVVVR